MDLTLVLTHDCNLACSYCYAGPKRRRAMSWATARQAIDFAFSFPEPSLQIGFFGGEPMLEWDLLQRALEAVEQQAADTGLTLKKTLTTNGTLMTVERAAWLGQHGVYVAISLDGNRAMHDATRPWAAGGSSFDACLRGLKHAREVLPDMEVIVVPDPCNVTHTAASVRFLIEELGVPRVSLNPNFYADWSEPALATLRTQYEAVGDFYLAWYRAGHVPYINVIDGKVITRLKDGFACGDRCKFGETEISVAPSGRIYPCERLVGDDTNDAMCIGTVTDGFDAPRRAAILARRGNVNPECATCAINHRCMNWCCCINYTMTGAIDTTAGVLCFHEQTAVAVADRVAGLLFAEHNPAFLARFYYEDFKEQSEEPARLKGVD